MPRHRRYRRTNRDKYSIEQTNIVSPVLSEWPIFEATQSVESNSRQYSIPILPPVEFEGMRKVKHLTISFSFVQDIPLFYAIVYVPQGYTPQPIHIPSAGNAITQYQANQFVMSSGILDFSGGPCRIKSRLSRNLNSGDSIALILASINASSDAFVFAQVSYAITLQ